MGVVLLAISAYYSSRVPTPLYYNGLSDLQIVSMCESPLLYSDWGDFSDNFNQYCDVEIV